MWSKFLKSTFKVHFSLAVGLHVYLRIKSYTGVFNSCRRDILEELPVMFYNLSVVGYNLSCPLKNLYIL